MADDGKEPSGSQGLASPSGGPVSPDGTANGDPVFYYSRERRLSRASPAVQSMNDENPVKPGFFKTLLAAKGNRFILSSIVLIIAVSGLASRFSRDTGADAATATSAVTALTLGRNILVLTMHREEGILLLEILKQAPQTGELYIGTVDVAVSPALTGEGEDREAPQVFTHRIVFNPAASEVYRLSLPFEGDDFFVVFNTVNEQRSVRVRAGGT